ncbi:MAG: acetyl-CoA carboxylase, biotin carboxyl carrier protein [Phycisphaerales bacterium]|jgi:acetyl-CoA carboxylase biotin carboxyl carrier protein|nr:acetyl-CoA carboxylase, biotin carboxyl carrier protein [Phycisphaerales bacterium]
MDLGLLEQIIALMNSGGLSTVELIEGDRSITLKRGQDSAGIAAAPMLAYAPPASANSSAAPSAKSPAAADDTGNLTQIKSPMVGTFYAAPAKGAKPYITVGARVDEDTDVCIIEAMKTFNVHKAETRGTIVKILVQDAQPVEFNQPLFLVKPD